MDFVKIQFELPFPARPQIVKPADWKQMPLYRDDFYAPQLEVVKGLVKQAKSDALVVMTLYSPFMCAGQTSDLVTRHLTEDPESVKKGLEIITDSLVTFVKACITAGVDGFYASTQGGEAKRFNDPGYFRDYIKPPDLVLMKEMQRSTVFNIVHVCDYVESYADVAPFLDYPGQIVNSPLTFGAKKYSPKELSTVFERPYMGGLERHGILATGNTADVKRATQDVLNQAPDRFILGADCTVPSDISWNNLKMAIATAHGA
jgi:uroporphyrinogen decarboxylase